MVFVVEVVEVFFVSDPYGVRSKGTGTEILTTVSNR